MLLGSLDKCIRSLFPFGQSCPRAPLLNDHHILQMLTHFPACSNYSLLTPGVKYSHHALTLWLYHETVARQFNWIFLCQVRADICAEWQCGGSPCRDCFLAQVKYHLASHLQKGMLTFLRVILKSISWHWEPEARWQGWAGLESWR